MAISKKILKIIFVIIIIPFLVGCSIASVPVPTPTNTSLPPTHTSIPPTPEPQPFVVTLDENGCTLSGPTEVPPGEYPFFVNNQREIDISFQYVRYFLNEKTYQDVLDLQNEPGEDFAMPSWTLEVPNYYSAGDDAYFYILDTPGEHLFYLRYYWKEISFLWLCPPFQVVDAPAK